MSAAFTKLAIGFLFKEAVRVAVRGFILPIAIPILVGVVGWSQDIPWFYLCVGVGLLFAAIPTGLLGFDEWRYRTRVADKLVFSNILVGKSLEDTEIGKSIVLGFMVKNTARFPIKFKVAELNTQVKGFYPPKKKYEVKEFTVPPNESWLFNDYSIAIKGQPDEVFEGQIQCRLEYGKPGRLNNVLDFKKKGFFQFNNKGGIESSNWIDQ